MADTLEFLSASVPPITIDQVRTVVGPDSTIIGMHSKYPSQEAITASVDDTGAWTMSAKEEKSNTMKIRQEEKLIKVDKTTFRIVYQLEGRYEENGEPTSLTFSAIVSVLNTGMLPQSDNLVLYCHVVSNGGVCLYYGPGNGIAVEADWVTTVADGVDVVEGHDWSNKTMAGAIYRVVMDCLKAEGNEGAVAKGGTAHISKHVSAVTSVLTEAASRMCCMSLVGETA